MRRPGYLGSLEDTWFGGFGLVQDLKTVENELLRDKALYELSNKYDRARGYRGNVLVPPVISDPAYSASHPLYRAMFLDHRYRQIPITRELPIKYNPGYSTLPAEYNPGMDQVIS